MSSGEPLDRVSGSLLLLLAGCWSSWGPADSAHDGDSDVTGDSAETGDGGDTADTADTGDSSETGDTDPGDSIDTTDSTTDSTDTDAPETGDTDTADTTDTSDTADTTDTSDTADTSDTSDTADTVDTADTGPVDLDGDGTSVEDGDCDDADPAVSPAAAEVCNGVDDDCDGEVDADAVDADTWYADADGDGYGDDASAAAACTPPTDTVALGGDCDDADAAVYPGAVEAWYDGIDGDCSGGSDFDQDGDGHDADDWGGEDCDDSDATRFPGARSWSVPGDAASVQEAVDLACTGETIEVAAGTWSENVDFGSKALDLVGAGPELTTISGVDYAAVVTMAGGSLSGFTLREGASRTSGGGVLVQGASSASLSDLRVIENLASDDGGGVAVVDSTEVSLRDCEIVGNEAGGSGGGLSFEAEATGGAWALELDGVSVGGNQADAGAGGIRVDATGAVGFVSVEIDDNYGSAGGGLSGSGELAWTGGGLSGNSGGDAVVGFTGGVAADGLALSANTGGIAIDGDLTAEDLTIVGSKSSGPTLWATGSATLTDLSLVGNRGSAILQVDAGFTLTRVEVVDAEVSSGQFAVQLTGSGVAEHMVIAGVSGGSGLGLVATDPAHFQQVDHLTVVGSEQYGVQITSVADLQFDLAHVLVADSGYTGFSGGSYRVGLEWADVSGSGWSEYSADLSSSDWATALELDPEFISYDPDRPPWAWDLHLQPGSPLVDVDSGATDADGSAADVGAYGGAAADPDWYADADLDGMPDGWEAGHGLDTGADDSGSDLDGDGLANAEELAAGTDPDDADTDDDHAADTETEPLSASLEEDAIYEAAVADMSLGGFCTLPDLDGDGIDELGVVTEQDAEYYREYFVEATASGTQSLFDYSTGPISYWDSFACTGIIGDFNADREVDVAVRYVPYLVVVAGPVEGGVSLSSGTNDTSYVTTGYAGVAADLDGDLVDDLAVAAPSYSGTYSYGGAVFVYTDVATSLDASSSLGTTEATLTILSDKEDEWFGSTVLSGDVNGDDHVDLVAANSEGTWIYHGPLTSTGTLTQSDADLATAVDPTRLYATMGQVALGGELDGDGVDELVFRQGSGSAGLFVFTDPADGVVLTDAAEIISDSPRGVLEGSVLYGDLDGDGLDDLFVGASGGEDLDTILVFYGASVLDAGRSADDADQALYDGGAGTGFASDFQVGDFDGDLRCDIATEASSGRVGVEIFFGSGFD